MNPRTLSIVVLGATLGLVIAFSLLRSHEPRSDATDSVVPSETPDGASRDDSVVTDGAAEPIDAARDDGAGATSSREESSAVERSPLEGALPTAAPPAPMAQALGELKIPPIPELLETERQFAAESVDPLWSQSMEGHILGEISQLTGLKLVGLQVECKTTLCRLQLVEPDLAKASSPYKSFPELVATFGLETRWVMSVVDRYGTPTSLAYLGRVEKGVTRSDAPQPLVQE